jgi:hypothetical protein
MMVHPTSSHVEHVDTEVIETHEVIPSKCTCLVSMMPDITQAVHVIRIATHIYVNLFLILIIIIYFLIVVVILVLNVLIFTSLLFLIVVLLKLVIIVILFLLFSFFLVSRVLERFVSYYGLLRMNSGDRPPLWL